MTSFTFNHPTIDEIGLAGVKAMFDLPEVIASLLGNSIKPTHSNCYELEDDICPFCRHQGCFKIYHSDPEDQHYHCFSCEAHGDIFQFLVSQELAEHAFEAANKLLKGEIEEATIITESRPKKPKAEPIVLTPDQYQRRQAVFVAAWEYYFEQMIDGDAEPLKYLATKRKISETTLVDYGVGYSKGELWRYLVEKGFELQDLYDSGLVQEGKFSPWDYFPKDAYIYPHYDKSGDICRFTFKYRVKIEGQKNYQLPKLFWLNDIQFYGQDSLSREGVIAIVEGEHDLIAMREHGWQGPILATNGSIGTEQYEWMEQHLADRQIVTLFDSDKSGDRYRENVGELSLASLIQVTLPEGQGKDIDDYLRLDNALSLDELVAQYGVDYSEYTDETEESEETEETEETCGVATEQQLAAPSSSSVKTIELPIDEDTFNDVGNADRLKTLTEGTLLYVPECNAFFSFIDGKWQHTQGKELAACRCVGENILDQASLLTEQALVAKDKAKLKLAEQLANFGRTSLNRKKMVDMLEIYKSDNMISANIFNADPMLLGVANGILDLAEGKLKPAAKEFYISRFSEVAFDATASCPRWLQFIEEITCGDKSYGEFLQRIVGYILTGRTDEQVLFFLHGHGCNGKSTFMNVIQRLMGEYYHQINSDVLLQSNSNGNGPNPSLAKLMSSRLVVANELPEGSRMDENLVKSMTGDDVIVARQLYAKVELEYRPMFKLIMVGNHKPVIRDTSTGMWRRMIMLPFNASFSKEQLDPRLMEKLYAELPGILNWALEGVRKWAELGIKASIPDSIKADIDEYRHESDLLAMFLEECTCPGEYIHTDSLYDAFRKWAERDGDWKMTRNIMTKRLVEKGFEKIRQASKAAIKGISLKSAYEPSVEVDNSPHVFMRNQPTTTSNYLV